MLVALPIATATAIALSYTMHEANYADADEVDEALREEQRHLERAVFIGLVGIYMLAISVGLSTTIFGITSEIIPNYLLAQASSLIAASGWLVNFGVTSVFLTILDDENGRWYVFLILAGFGLLTILFVVFLVPETMGKTVKENLETIIGKDTLNRKRSELRREFGIKDVDVASKSVAVKKSVQGKKEAYQALQQA